MRAYIGLLFSLSASFLLSHLLLLAQTSKFPLKRRVEMVLDGIVSPAWE